MVLNPIRHQFLGQCPDTVKGKHETGKFAAAISFCRQREFRLMDVCTLHPFAGSILKVVAVKHCEMACQNIKIRAEIK